MFFSNKMHCAGDEGRFGFATVADVCGSFCTKQVVPCYISLTSNTKKMKKSFARKDYNFNFWILMEASHKIRFVSTTLCFRTKCILPAMKEGRFFAKHNLRGSAFEGTRTKCVFSTCPLWKKSQQIQLTNEISSAFTDTPQEQKANPQLKTFGVTVYKMSYMGSTWVHKIACWCLLCLA